MLFKKRKLWIVVADGARARILERKGRGKPLKLVREMESPESRRPTREQGTGKPGRGFSPGAGRHEFSDPVDWQEAAKVEFLGEVADHLVEAAHRDAFDALSLVAPPKALGELRAQLGTQLADRIRDEVNKDLTRIPLHDLPEHLKKIVRL